MRVSDVNDVGGLMGEQVQDDAVCILGFVEKNVLARKPRASQRPAFQIAVVAEGNSLPGIVHLGPEGLRLKDRPTAHRALDLAVETQ